MVVLIATLGLPGADGHGPALPGLGAGAPGGAGGTVADAVSALVVLYAAVRAVRLARRPLTRTAAVVLGLPVAGFAVAALGAADPATGLAGFARYLQVFVLVPTAVLLLVRDRAQLRLLAWALVSLALWEGGLGVAQYATGTGASYMGSGIRAVGTFGAGDIMGMATVVAYGLVCAVGLALAPGDAGTAHGTAALRTAAHGPVRADRWRRAVALGCAVVLVVPLAVSFSRGAWIATAVACGAQLALTGLRRAVAAGAALAAALVVLVAGIGVGGSMLEQRLSSITHVTDAPDQSVVDRYTMWSAALGMWRERPVTGVGLKGFPANRDSRASLALSSGSDTEGAGAAFRRQPLLSPHNMYLLVLSEQGLLGLVPLAGGWAALLVCGIRRAARARRAAVPGHSPTPGRPSVPVHPPAAGHTPAPVPAEDPAPARSGRGLDCALLACGLLVWQLVDFVYADIGGPSTALTAVVLGVAAWWALGTATADGTAATETPGARPMGRDGGGATKGGATKGGGETTRDAAPTRGGAGAGDGARPVRGAGKRAAAVDGAVGGSPAGR
ncbi:O-antigen ligase family protein [Streptomyces sulfonofaciens]|uniref:O-antigen ligase family protein n=1 Tax=Streptomyces sulfonofaciens TaxID=68272 RepID=UPI003570F7CB